MFRIRWVILSLLLLQPQPAFQQTLLDDKEIPRVKAYSRSGEVHLDGRLSDAAWLEAVPATDFIQSEPIEGARAQEEIEVRVLYDSKALYVGAMMYDEEPDKIADQLVRRDEGGAYDYFELSLDSNNDRLTGYSFRVSAAGVQRDVYLSNDTDEDDAWDSVWDSAVYRDSTGWSAELVIPFSQLRYDAGDSIQSWGINFSRRRLKGNEISYFALESRLHHGRVSVFGRLEGLRFSSKQRRFEVRPYALTSATRAPVEAGDPFFDGSELSGRFGADFRYGLGNNYSLDLTINPDFGQVEVDPAVINLTAFETFFREKRPFFVEDVEIFDFDLSGSGSNQLFYSRRIGREPQGSVPGKSDFEEIPTQTTILGAAKLTGRSSSGLSIGALAALTSLEHGKSYSEDSGQIQEFPVEPTSFYGVLRARQEFREGASQVGAMVTTIQRDLPENGTLNFLTSDAYGFGIDFEHNWGGTRNRDWVLIGHAVASLIRGSPESITDVQTSSNHYFQRPDASRYNLDTTATSLLGSDWKLEFRRRSAEHWTGGLWVREISPDFEVNDIGFSTTAEGFNGGGRLSYQEIRPGSLFRNYEFRVSADHDFRHSVLDNISLNSVNKAYDGGRWSFDTAFQFLNYWGIDLEFQYSPENLTDSATRGGPLMIEPASRSLEFRLYTDSRKDLALEPSVDFQDDHRGGYEWQAGLGMEIRPFSGWEIQLEPGYSIELDPAQYVETVEDPAYAPTFGHRYIFGELKQKSFSLETRLNVSFSPKLTIQFYADPLISSGKYQKYKQLVRPSSFDFDAFEEGSAILSGDEVACTEGRTCVQDGERYVDHNGDGRSDFSFSDEDFSVRSLKLNAVMRWEFHAGSTLYLVWQSSRRSDDNSGRFNLDRSFSRLWQSESDNTFIVKMNYWFSL